MESFPATFLLIPYQLSLGGLLALAVPPFHEMGRGFYKSTAVIFLASGILSLLGEFRLSYLNGISPWSWGTFPELFFHTAFVIFLTLYVISLWGERTRFRARVFSFSLLTGLIGLFFMAFRHHQGAVISLESLFFPLSFLLSALLLGSVTVSMLLGHWYLIDTGQSLEPFHRIFKYFVVLLILQTALFLASPLYLLLGSEGSQGGFQRLWENHWVLGSTRSLVGLVGPLALSAMIWETLKIPNTMAATGLFYIALLGVFVGEILGRHLLALTSLPL